MERQKQDKILLCISIACFLFMSLTFLIMPIEIPEGNARLLSCLVGAAFWTTMAAGIIIQIILSRRRIHWEKEHALFQKHGFHIRIGVCAFAQNLYALAADVLCAISLIAFIGSMIITKSTGYSCYVTLSVFSFAFCMHCILNGKIFDYVQNQDKILAQQGHK